MTGTMFWPSLASTPPSRALPCKHEWKEIPLGMERRAECQRCHETRPIRLTDRTPR